MGFTYKERLFQLTAAIKSGDVESALRYLSDLKIGIIRVNAFEKTAIECLKENRSMTIAEINEIFDFTR